MMGWKKILLISLFALGLIGLGYFFIKQFQNDRQEAMEYQEKPTDTVSLGQEKRLPDGRTVRTYTSKDIEEARKKGQLPKEFQANNPNAAAAANDAAIQRTLRTIEEINKINEMNRRLQEQQQLKK